jgi:predicted MFS family arabinose efflux permease
LTDPDRPAGPDRSDGAGPGEPHRDTPRIWLLQLVAVVSALDRFLIAPLLVPIARDLDVPLADVVPAATAYFLAYGVMQPVWAMLADRLGRVRTMRLALGLAAVTGLASAVAPDPAMLTVARAAAGACFSAALPLSLVYVGDTAGQAVRQGRITDVMTGVATGTTLASAGAALVAGQGGWRWAFAFNAVVAAGLCALLRVLPEPAASGSEAAGGVRRRTVLVLARGWPLFVLALAFVEGMVLLGLFTFVPAALVHAGSGTATAGLVTAVYGVGVLVFAQVVKRWSRRMPRTRLAVIGGAGMVSGLALIGYRQSVPAVLGGCLLFGVAWAFLHSTLQTWATSVAPAARATAVAYFAAALFAGSAVGAAAGGPFADAGRYGTLFGAGAVIGVPLTAAAWVGLRRYAGRPAPG